MFKKLCNPEFDRDIEITIGNQKLFFIPKEKFADEPHEYQLLCMIIARVQNCCTDKERRSGSIVDVVFDIYHKCKQADIYSPEMDIQLAQQLVNHRVSTALENLRKPTRRQDSKMLTVHARFASLDAPISKEEGQRGTSLGNILPDSKQGTPAEQAIKREQDRRLKAEVAKLTPRQQQLTEMLANGVSYTEMGKELNLSDSAARKAALKVLALLRSILEAKAETR